VSQNNEDFTLDKCRFFNNSAPRAGGAEFHADNKGVMVKGCIFEGNHANKFVGGLEFQNDNERITVESTNFIGNRGQSGTGALQFYDHNFDINVTNCIFRLNSAEFEGGAAIALHLHNSKFLITDCVVENNTNTVGMFSKFCYQLRVCL
jgi:hypothetical protein